MLYNILKIPARIALVIYCRDLKINDRRALAAKGPLLIAANHPNSFLDAIIIATLFDQPVYSLARGDAFTNRFTISLLKSLNILPVYRLSEGAENLGHNYSTFEQCRDIFKKNGIVLIFSEGRCINEWKLRPLMKGTARLAISSWEEGINLTILPAGINYHSFTRFGKHIHLHFGKPFTKEDIATGNGYGKTIQDFNTRLTGELQDLVLDIEEEDHASRRQLFGKKTGTPAFLWLALPAMTGWLLHAPLYYPIRWITHRKAAGTGHYDSIMVGLLFLLYPVYLLFAALICWKALGGYWWQLVFVVMPFTAWSFVQWKERF